MMTKNEERRITYRGVVYPWQCDHMGHMNVMWYTGKFDEATWNFFAALGITPGYIRDSNNGIAGVQQNISYKMELAPGDPLVVRTSVLEVRPKVIRILHEMFNEEKDGLAATSELTVVHISLLTRKACPYPDVVQEKARCLQRNDAD
jgi:acyl-CoA thioester hydrolase